MSVELLPPDIPGYEGGPYSHQPDLLHEPLFFLAHLYSCVHSEEAEEALFGADYEAAAEFQRGLIEAAEWPVFSLPLANGHWLSVVYRAFEDESGVDYLVHHPDWPVAEQIAGDEGHFSGPGLSWAELRAAAWNGIGGGSTDDPLARLLLLFPALCDDDVPEDAAEAVAGALAALTRVADPRRAAEHLVADQGPAGRATWSVGDSGVWTCDGSYAQRSRGSLPGDRLARISTALNAG